MARSTRLQQWIIAAGSAAAIAMAVPAIAQLSNPRTGMAGGPVAKPVDADATAGSRVVVAVKPIGSIPYDGMVLPLVSPDGRFIATQDGRPASWEQIWGLRATLPPMGLKLAVYSVPAVGEVGSLKPVATSRALPTGAILGRAADTRGFLVEMPRAGSRTTDGRAGEPARWIGRVEWLSGEVHWLVQGEGSINAQAVLSSPAAGDLATDQVSGRRQKLAYIRKRTGVATFELVVRAVAGGPELVYADPRENLLFPTFSPDGSTVTALSVPADEADGAVTLVAFSVPDFDGAGALTELGRLDVALGGGVGAAYQCVASLQLPMPMPLGEAGPSAADARERFGQGLTVVSARDAGPLWWDPRTSEVVNLASGAVVGVPFLHGGGSSGTGAFGVVLANAKGLTYQPLRAAKLNPEDLQARPPVSAGREVPVLAGRGVPRATWAANPSGGASSVLLVFSTPKTGDSPRFEILQVSAAKPE